jgi:hypothetical protein
MKRSTQKVIFLGFLAFLLMIPATDAIVGAQELFEPAQERDLEAPEGEEPSRASNLTYYTVNPCRLADSRPSQGGVGPIWAGWYYHIYAAGTCGVPFPAAKAVMVNITAVDSWGTGHLRAYAYNTPRPFAATLSYGADPFLGQGIANAAIIPICEFFCDWDMIIYTSNTTDIVVDVMGYFR